MLGRNYVVIDGTGFTPSDFNYELQPVEEVETSEAGTELIEVKRLDKHVFHASWEGIDSTLLATLEALCKKRTVTVVYREESYTCRARGISPSLASKSWKYRHSDGIWNAAITLTQI